MKALPLQPHPFRLLLYLEWILLGLSAFKLFGFPGWGRPVLWNNGELYSTIATKTPQMLAIALLLTVFGVMGLRLPTVRWSKLLYLVIAFGLIGAIGQLQGWGLDSLSPLLIAVVLRSSVLFGQTGKWAIAGLVWLVYPFTLVPFLAVWAVMQIVKYNLEGVTIPGLVMLPDGGAQFSLSFNPEQVQQFVTYVQNTVLYFLADALLSFGLILIFVLLLVNSLTNERQGRRKLALAHEQLYQYSVQIEDQATLQERTRIAREIHDSLGHLLTAQSVVLENTALSLKVDPQEAKAFLEDSKRLGAEARRELRQAISMLRSDPLKGKPFEEAIVQLVAEFNHITGINPMLEMNLPIQFPDRYQVAAYRILEEALTNIQKHSEATEVTIKLEIQSIDKLEIQSIDKLRRFYIYKLWTMAKDSTFSKTRLGLVYKA
ncbi:MAG: sensor histidine kinase [Cyanobacteria bacterium RM1_2_2]|nr:sensor histidine kinase [Cyanobacteria bacterium RM1_2_2]